MKRAMIGGFFSLVGTIWALAAIIFAGNNMVSSRPTRQGRFLTAVIENGMAVPMLIATLLFVFGVVVMGIEYFKKDN